MLFNRDHCIAETKGKRRPLAKEIQGHTAAEFYPVSNFAAAHSDVIWPIKYMKVHIHSKTPCSVLSCADSAV